VSRPRHCSDCGQLLIEAERHRALRLVCPDCGYVHFPDPKVGVGALVVRDGAVLLVRRGAGAEIGRWSLPAGYLDAGEDPRKAAAREVDEETGVQVRCTDVIDVYANGPGAGASIFILFRAEDLGGEPVAGDDATEAGFFAPGQLPDIAFASARSALAPWLAAEEQPNSGDM
jgi:8-oxo-dGTP diphosphatase